jgi:hypothetical protein
MFDMELLKRSLAAAEGDKKRAADAEYAVREAAMIRKVQMGKPKENDIRNLLKKLDISDKTIQEESQAVVVLAENELKAFEELQDTPDELLALETEQLQSMQVAGLSSMIAAQNAGIQSAWWGNAKPYYCCGGIWKHNEGGVTNGGYSCPRYAVPDNRMNPWAYAKGDGALGYTDDNDVTVENTLWFAYWPTGYEVVRPRAWVCLHGVYGIYSNDKWYNHRWAKLNLQISIDVSQDFWVGAKSLTIKVRSNDNISENGRIDQCTTIEANPLTVGANKWVLITVTARLRVETEGDGSWAKLYFTGSDHISATMLAIR